MKSRRRTSRGRRCSPSARVEHQRAIPQKGDRFGWSRWWRGRRLGSRVFMGADVSSPGPLAMTWYARHRNKTVSPCNMTGRPYHEVNAMDTRGLPEGPRRRDAPTPLFIAAAGSTATTPAAASLAERPRTYTPKTVRLTPRPGSRRQAWSNGGWYPRGNADAQLAPVTRIALRVAQCA